MKFEFPNTKKLNELKDNVETLKKHLEEASGFIGEVEKGNLTITISKELEESTFGTALVSMQRHLSKIASEEMERNWINTGLAKFSDILRNKEEYNFEELSDNILLNIVKYLGANQGAIFVLNDSVKGDENLELIACYAYDRKKYLNKKIALGDGLAGQCALEKEAILLTEVPSDYIKINSGLGDASPKCVFISPLKINEKVFGVLELATFTPLPVFKIDFITRLSENIASSIKNVKDSQLTQNLLNASQQQTEELRAQEEEMRQNMEEMLATQEEMSRKNVEIARNAAESKGILEGINATMATIQFTPEGIITGANDNFLKAVKFSEEEIKGRHHEIFVPKKIAESNEYKSFWQRLASGKQASGIFQRIDSDGNFIWLNAIYNPIRNEEGKVVKVIKFATDITEQQETLAQNKGLLEGINNTMATIEFTPQGIVSQANANFLSVMGYSIDEVKGKHHQKFVPGQILKSEDYKNFWPSLASGIPVSGVFERINSSGRTVWLNAVYNPILNANGEVTKVVKFATDVTSTRQMQSLN